MARQYDGVAQGRRLERLEWPVYALLRPEFPDRLTIGPIDLTGPARFIFTMVRRSRCRRRVERRNLN